MRYVLLRTRSLRYLLFGKVINPADLFHKAKKDGSIVDLVARPNQIIKGPNPPMAWPSAGVDINGRYYTFVEGGGNIGDTIGSDSDYYWNGSRKLALLVAEKLAEKGIETTINGKSADEIRTELDKYCMDIWEKPASEVDAWHSGLTLGEIAGA